MILERRKHNEKTINVIVMWWFISWLSFSIFSKVSDADKELVSGSQLKITKQDFFEYLLDNGGTTEIVKEVLTTIADKEVTDQSELDALVKQREEDYAKYADGNLEKYAKN